MKQYIERAELLKAAVKEKRPFLAEKPRKLMGEVYVELAYDTRK